MGALLAGGAAAVASTYGAHRPSHGTHQLGYGGYGAYNGYGHGKMKHGKFKHGKHGMYGKHKFKGWK
jgi:hypothetical protein